MKVAPLPADEQERLAALKKYNILDTEPEAAFDSMVQLAAYICQTPIAAISLVDEQRQWFKAITGLDAKETSRKVAFCAHTILQDEPMIVHDAQQDERFFDNPLVTSAPNIRFYAGVPLVTSDGHHLGTLCVIDRVPRELDQAQLEAIMTLANSIMAHLDLRLSHKNFRQYADDLQLMATIFEASSDGMIVTDVDNCIVTVNPAFTAITGYTLHDVAGKNPGLLSSGRQSKEFYQNMWNTLNATGKWSDVVWNKHKNGELFAEQLSINVIFNQDGTKRLHVAIFSDITPRKMLEENLVAASKEIEDLYNKAPCGYHSVGPDGTYLRINDTELAWLGCSREELIGKMKPYDFYTPASKELFLNSFPNFVRDGHVENLEFDLVGKDSIARHVSINATAIRDSEGNFIMSRTVVHDITEQHQIEEKLHQLTLEQHAMLDNEMVGIVKMRDRHIIWRNKAMDRIFGYELGELVGKPTTVFYKDEAAYQALGEAAYPILKSKGVYRAQVEMVRKTGEVVWIDLSGVQLPGNNEESMWMLSDITPMVKHHEEVERIAHHDILTDLPNRLLLTDRIAQALAQAERAGRLLAVCYLDLDGFKSINDNFGHEAGDNLLKEIAHRMLASVRANDTVARLGGDEFVLLLTNLENVEEYQAVLERVITEINKPVALDGPHEVNVTASIGITLFPFDSDDSDILLRHADLAMYQAKKMGRNCVCLYSPDIKISEKQILGIISQ